MTTKTQVHPSVTRDRVFELAEISMLDLCSYGICLACGEDFDGIEPDARRYECECCGEPKVYGAEELMIMLA